MSQMALSPCAFTAHTFAYRTYFNSGPLSYSKLFRSFLDLLLPHPSPKPIVNTPFKQHPKMLTRRVLAALPRAARPVANRIGKSICASATRRQPEKIAETQVPVVTYAAGHDDQTKAEAVLTVDASKSMDSALPIQVHDVAKQASALKQGVADNLTPTLKKFTLQGKVAIVTGYVSFRSFHIPAQETPATVNRCQSMRLGELNRVWISRSSRVAMVHGRMPSPCEIIER